MMKKFISKVNNFSQIDRIIILVLGGVIISSMFFYFVIYPLQSSSDDFNILKKDMKQNLQMIKRLNNRSKSLIYQDQRLSSQQVSGIIQNFLGNYEGIQLVGLKRGKSVLLNRKTLRNRANSRKNRDMNPILLENSSKKRFTMIFDIPIYANETVVTLMGNYHDTLKFLKEISEMQSEYFLWQRMSYSVEKYPFAIVNLSIRTYGSGRV